MRSLTVSALPSPRKQITDMKTSSVFKSNHLTNAHLNYLLPFPVRFKLIWSQSQKMFKSVLRELILLTLETEAENPQTGVPGFHFVGFGNRDWKVVGSP